MVVALILVVLRDRLLAVKEMLVVLALLVLVLAVEGAVLVRLVQHLLDFRVVQVVQGWHQALLVLLLLMLVAAVAVQTTLLHLLRAVQAVAVMADQLTLAYLQQPD